MTLLACLHCAATTSNGLVLCDLCQRKAATDLEFLPIYFRNLARWRPGRAGSRQMPGSRVLWDGSVRKGGDRISDRLDEAANELVTWARALADDRGDFPRPLTMGNAVLTSDLSDEVAEELADNQGLMVEWLCATLDHHLVSIATLEWAGEFVREVGQHEAVLRGLTETAAPGWYAGACRRRIAMDATCGAPTYVIPGITWVTCKVCGSTTYARDHLEAVLDEARGWVARPKALAEAIVAMVDTEQSVPRLYERIRKWGNREPVRLEAVRKSTYAPKRYRLGDVLDVLLAEGETRVNDEKRMGA